MPAVHIKFTCLYLAIIPGRGIKDQGRIILAMSSCSFAKGKSQLALLYTLLPIVANNPGPYH